MAKITVKVHQNCSYLNVSAKLKPEDVQVLEQINPEALVVRDTEKQIVFKIATTSKDSVLTPKGLVISTSPKNVTSLDLSFPLTTENEKPRKLTRVESAIYAQVAQHLTKIETQVEEAVKTLDSMKVEEE
jgi:hypothetical protein